MRENSNFAMLMSASPHSLQRYNKFRSLLSQSSFQNPTKQKILLIQKSVDCGAPANNLCGKKASMLRQSKRPDWGNQSFRSRSDVTALLSPDSPCSVVNHTKLGFKGAQKFEDLTKSKNFCGTLLHKISFIVLAKKNFWG